MAFISSFTYCDTIQTEMTPQGPRHQITNPLQALSPVAIPGNFSFSIACSIAGFDAMQENCLRMMFLSPNEEILYDTGDVLFKIPNDQIRDADMAGMQFNLDIRNLVMREVGIYSTKIVFNDVTLGEYKIQVTKSGE